MNTLLKKAIPQIKSTKHLKKDQWDRLKKVYLEYRPIFDLQQLRMKNLDKKAGKTRNLGYSKETKKEFYRWYVEHFGPTGEVNSSPIIPSQTMFHEFRSYAYMLHPDESICGGTRVFAKKEKESFTLGEYKKMTMLYNMKPEQRKIVLSQKEKRFYSRYKDLYLQIKGSVQIMKRQGII